MNSSGLFLFGREGRPHPGRRRSRGEAGMSGQAGAALAAVRPPEDFCFGKESQGDPCDFSVGGLSNTDVQLVKTLQGYPKGSEDSLRQGAHLPTAVLWFKTGVRNLQREGGKTRRRQTMKWLRSVTNSVDTSVSKLREMVRGRQAWRAAVHGVTKSSPWLSN